MRFPRFCFLILGVVGRLFRGSSAVAPRLRGGERPSGTGIAELSPPPAGPPRCGGARSPALPPLPPAVLLGDERHHLLELGVVQDDLLFFLLHFLCVLGVAPAPLLGLPSPSSC